MTRAKLIWGVCGGHGQTGKSTFCANLGCGLALRGKNVAVIDADPGQTLYRHFGIKDMPRPAMPVKIEALAGVGGGMLSLVSMPAGHIGASFQTILNLIDAEFVIVDIGVAGELLLSPDSPIDAYDVLALFREGFIMITPDQDAMQAALKFLKGFVYKRAVRLFPGNDFIIEIIREAVDPECIESTKKFVDLCEDIAVEFPDEAGRILTDIKGFNYQLLLNMANSPEDLSLAEGLRSAVSDAVGLELGFAGEIYRSEAIKASLESIRPFPFMLDEAAIESQREMEAIITRLIGRDGGRDGTSLPKKADEAKKDGRVPARQAPDAAMGLVEGASEHFGFNDNVPHMNAVYHVQTEVSKGGSPVIDTVVYQAGRIFFSKKTPWQDVKADMSLRDYAAKQHRTIIAAIKLGRITDAQAK